VKNILLYILIIMGCAAYALPSINQHRKKKTANDERIVLRHADNLRFSENEMNGAQRLSGKVILAHAGMVMHCDSAVLYEASQTFDAFGKVNIVQGDTLTLKGDKLHYDGETQIAEMRKNVVMIHRKQVPFFIKFEVDPARIDVNIHPTKTEIKFEDDSAIFQILLAAVRESLGKYGASPVCSLYQT
jgi:lipopolysaccharide assembly outer membrane protein LptD (OstA)